MGMLLTPMEFVCLVWTGVRFVLVPRTLYVLNVEMLLFLILLIIPV